MSGFPMCEPQSFFKEYWQDDRIEREFVESGYQCCTRTNGLGHRCGYVAISKTHPLFGLNDYDIDAFASFSVDGGITFAEGMGDKWIFGWDAAHCWHKPDPSIMDAQFRKRYEQHPELYYHSPDAVMVDADMAEFETRKLAIELRVIEEKGIIGAYIDNTQQDIKEEDTTGAVAYRVRDYRGFSDFDNKNDYNFDEIVYFDSRFSKYQIDEMLAHSIFDVDEYRCVTYEFERVIE